MQLDLKKRPLGQYLSRHLLFEEWDPQGKGWAKGLYLALAQETTSMFASTVDRSAGFIRLEPTVNGAAADYTVSADPSCAKSACAGGGRAGCSAKDFYNTALKLSQLETKKKK